MGILSGLLAYGIGCVLDPKPKYVGITEREIERRKKMGLPPLKGYSQKSHQLKLMG